MVMDNGLPARSNEADVTIIIQTAQLPIFISTPYSTTVLETAQNNSQVFRVTATDADGQVKEFFKIYLKKIINLSQTNPFFTCLQYKTFENTGGKAEIARKEQFLLFPQHFLPSRRTFCHTHQI